MNAVVPRFARGTSPSTMLQAAIVIGFGYLGMATPIAAQGYSQEQQQLCSGDAFRLCGPEIPDVDRVTACMIRQRALLSRECQSVFRYEPPPADVAAPLRITRPTSARAKAAKARKEKKPKR